jgi:hypothetical protein
MPRLVNPPRLDELKEFVVPFWPEYRSPVGKVLHALHAFHHWPDPRDPSKASKDQMLAALLDFRVASQWYDGKSPLLRTEHGIRFAWTKTANSAAQPHVGQAIAELALLGIELDRPVIVPDGIATVDDIVNDVIANLSLDGEFEWSALAVVLFRPDQSEWTNRYGRTIEVDDVVGALITKNLATASCGGTHTLFALAAILQIDGEHHLLTPQTRKQVHDYLQKSSQFVTSLQRADGAFDSRWNQYIESESWYHEICCKSEGPQRVKPSIERTRRIQRELASDSEFGRLLATGHHLEWFLLLPPELQPPPATFESACRFLKQSLIDAKVETRDSYYCPYSHAISVLTTLSVDLSCVLKGLKPACLEMTISLSNKEK